MHPLVDAARLEARLGDAGLCVLDCSITHQTYDDRPAYGNGRSSWIEGHIPGSQHVDLVGDLSDRASDVPLMMPPVEQFRDAMQAVGVQDGQQIVLYDNNFSMWAARVWWMLRAAGVDAAVLDGGWRTWSAEQRPVETGEQAPRSTGTLTVSPRPDLFATKDDVLAQLDDDSTCLIDALHPAVFRGDRLDYARPGHIPGARNVSSIHLVDRETHRYLPVPELRERFDAASPDTAERVITYCGGGVAASSAALALTLLGVPRVAVYDGSLNEWSNDPALPMVSGSSEETGRR